MKTSVCETAGSDSSRVATSDALAWGPWITAILLLAHAAATCHFLAPATVLRVPFLSSMDYPFHTHRAYVYREALRESGWPWGCDPDVCAGIVIDPAQNTGGKPQQVLARFFPRVGAGRIVAVFTWVAVLMCVPMLVLAARILELNWEEAAWAAILGAALLWFAPPYRIMLKAGMIAFLSSSYMCLFVLAAYLRFLRAPALWGFVGVTAAGSLLLLLHPLGPLAILPALIWLVLSATGVRWRWRLLAVGSAVIISAANAFWLIPMFMALRAPLAPWAGRLPQFEMTYWNWESWSDLAATFHPAVLVAHLAALPVAAVGLMRIARRQSRCTAINLGLVLATSLLLFLFGSFWSGTRVLQPVRFVVVLWTVLAVLGGTCIAGLRVRCKIPPVGAAVGLLLAGTLLTGLCFSVGFTLKNGPDDARVREFIAEKTAPGERLLIEAVAQFGRNTQALPEVVGREVIGSAFPDAGDPIQFLPQRLFGRDAGALTVNEARQTLERFGVNWVFAKSGHWQDFFRRLTGSDGQAVGTYRVFVVSRDTSRFLLGSGELVARVNRIELRNVHAHQNAVVLKYRFHPGWVCAPPSAIEPFPIPEYPAGLLLIRHPPSNLDLRFDPLRALRQPWPRPSNRTHEPGAAAGFGEGVGTSSAGPSGDAALPASAG